MALRRSDPDGGSWPLGDAPSGPPRASEVSVEPWDGCPLARPVAGGYGDDDDDDAEARADSVLEWDLEKELSGRGASRAGPRGQPGPTRLVHGFSNSAEDLALEGYSMSPRGRFQRLHPDPDDPDDDEMGLGGVRDPSGPPKHRRPPEGGRPPPADARRRLVGLLAAGAAVLAAGVLIGYAARGAAPAGGGCGEKGAGAATGAATTVTTGRWAEEKEDAGRTRRHRGVAENVTQEAVAEMFGLLRGVAPTERVPLAERLGRLWETLGLSDVRVGSHGVLRAGPPLNGTPSNITILSGSSVESSCYWPSGQPCGVGHYEPSRFFAAHSRSGEVEGDLIDVWLGRPEDLGVLGGARGVGGPLVALLRVGGGPMLYTLGALARLGVSTVLVYADAECDGFGRTDSLTLNLATADDDAADAAAADDDDDIGGDGTVPDSLPMIVQPIAASLAQILSPRDAQRPCGKPLKTPGGGPPRRVRVWVGGTERRAARLPSVSGWIKGTHEPDRCVVVGGRLGDGFRGDAVAVTTMVMALTTGHRSGWSPRRSLLFCLWGADAASSALGAWAEEEGPVVRDRAVAYVSLSLPVWGRGGGTGGTATHAATDLRALASPTLRQLGIDSLCGGEPCRGWRSPESLVSSSGSTRDVTLFAETVGVPCIKFLHTEDNADPSVWEHTERTEVELHRADSNWTLLTRVVQLSVGAALRLVDDAVLPLRVIDPALDAQSLADSLKQRGPACVPTNGTVGPVWAARGLREAAARLQSAADRPASDPGERDELRVRALNDALRSVERALLLPSSSRCSSLHRYRSYPGISRHVLMRPSRDWAGTFPLLEASLRSLELREGSGGLDPATRCPWRELSLTQRAMERACTFLEISSDIFEQET